jgi:Ca2+-transporting ATPase
MMQRQLGRHWFHMTPEEVARLLDVEVDKGLDLFEVKHRTERFGANRLSPKRKQGAFTRFLLQFHNPLIYILLAAAVITATVKREGVDAAIILAVVLINAVISYLQEAKAEKAIEALIQSMDTEATVLRAGRTLGVSAVELIPGDIVLLKAGDRVPADVRLVRSKDLQVAEAALTGESVPVQKSAEAILAPETPIADRRNMAFTSTLITHGQGTGIVTATGDHTEIGRISELIGSASDIATPLTRKIAAFSSVILCAVVSLAAATFAVGLLRG